jgi:hypothetical protein
MAIRMSEKDKDERKDSQWAVWKERELSRKCDQWEMADHYRHLK